MALFYWNAMLESGNAKIDQDHKKLFDLTNAVAASVRNGGSLPEVAALICELKLYAKSHFQAEEELAASSSLPPEQRACHVCEHRDFLKRVQEIEQQNYPSDIDAISRLLNFLITWLVTHILRWDYQLVEALPNAARRHGDGLSPEHVLISALVEAERRFRLVAEEAPTMIWLCGPSGKREFVNRGWIEFAGWSAARANEFDWTGLLHPGDRARHARFIDDRMASKTRGHNRIPCHEGQRRVGVDTGSASLPAWMVSIALACSRLRPTYRDVRQAQHFLSDINETVEREVSERTRELENLAAADPLTGLANRRIFLETLERSTRQAQKFRGAAFDPLYGRRSLQACQ